MLPYILLALLILAVSVCWLIYIDLSRYKAEATAAEAERESHVQRVRELESQVSDAELDLKLARLAQQKRNVTWVKPARRLDPPEVRRAFAVAKDAPLWVALNQELDDYLQDQLDQVSLPPSTQAMTEQQRLHLAGGIEHLRLFHKRLLELQHAGERGAEIDPAADM